MGIVSGGGGGGGITPPVTIAGTNAATIPLTVIGAHNEGNDIFAVESFDGSLAFHVAGNGADYIDAIELRSGAAFNLNVGTTASLAANGTFDIAAPRILFGGATAAPADAFLPASFFALWLDDTVGATKLMIKAKDSGGTVRAAAIALA